MMSENNYIATVAICSFIDNEPSRLLASTIKSIIDNYDINGILIYIVLDGCIEIPPELKEFANSTSTMIILALEITLTQMTA